MAKPIKKTKRKFTSTPGKPVVTTLSTKNTLLFLIPVLALIFLLFLPVLRNGFTNWDDAQYVTENPLLKELNVEGIKAIFSKPVVSNYHPLTIFSLAINYQFAGLTPWSYHLTSVILHVLNTALVFWFIMILSGKNKWVSAFSALLFGIHPMHVESVAWISERKDLLYTLFYLMALITYTRYLQKKQIKFLVIVSVLGILSLLSKPAAIVLPLSLLLLDYFFRRPWSLTWIVEKLPLFIFSAIMAYITVNIQSEKAIASLELYSFTERICFAGFGLIWYLLKIIFPYPLSALHPFPETLPVIYYIATLVAILGSIFLLIKVKNRLYHFGIGFYIVNLILVLQLVSIGNAVVAERYSYVPYIGIFFMLSMEGYRLITTRLPKLKMVFMLMAVLWLSVLSIVTWKRLPAWKSSEALWNNVLKHYPESPRAWTNKGLMYYDTKEWGKVIDHLSNALNYDPQYANALEWRARVYLETSENGKALEDALAFHTFHPSNTESLFILARSYEATGQINEAMDTYHQLIEKEPRIPEYWNNRGTLYFNQLKRYEDAKKDFEQCIRLDASNGMYFLNLSRCHYMLNDMPSAKENAIRARELGTNIDVAYANAIGLQ